MSCSKCLGWLGNEMEKQAVLTVLADLLYLFETRLHSNPIRGHPFNTYTQEGRGKEGV